MIKKSEESVKENKMQKCQYKYKFEEFRGDQCPHEAKHYNELDGKKIPVCYWHEKRDKKNVIVDIGKNLGKMDLREAYLCNAHLVGAVLFDADLRAANLNEANCQNTNLNYARLQKCEINVANLNKARLYKAKLQESWLYGTYLNEANLQQSNFQNAKMGGISLIKSNLNMAHLEGAFISNSYLQQANLIDSFFNNAILKNTDLRKANLNKADFTGANLEEADFQEANLRNSKFQNAYLVNANLQKTKLWGAELQKANLEGADLQDSNLKEANLTGADFFHCKLRNSDLKNSTFSYKTEDIIQKDWGKDQYLKAEEVYRELKNELKDEGLYDISGELYYKEMIMRRKQLRPFKGLIWNIILYIIAGYGERPRRALAIWFAIIIISALIYWHFDGIMMDENYNYDPCPQEALYFSIVTFTTLGFGDLRPKPEFQIFASLEALLGAIFMAIFIFVFARKMIRY